MSQFLLFLVLGCIDSTSTQVVCALLQLLSRSSPILEDLFCINGLSHDGFWYDQQYFDILYPVHCSVKIMWFHSSVQIMWFGMTHVCVIIAICHLYDIQNCYAQIYLTVSLQRVRYSLLYYGLLCYVICKQCKQAFVLGINWKDSCGENLLYNIVLMAVMHCITGPDHQSL